MTQKIFRNIVHESSVNDPKVMYSVLDNEMLPVLLSLGISV